MNNTKDKYYSIQEASQGEFKDRGSKFIAYASPVSHTEATKTFLQHIKKDHPKATHHCFAYRIGTNGQVFRSSDDGEPGGSAGRPILGQLDSFGLTNVMVVVVRYYGGTMLGVPGLINAYKTATANALKNASVCEKWICKEIEIQTGYQTLSEVLYLLKTHEAEILHQDLQLFCVLKAAIPVIHWEHCIHLLEKNRQVEIKHL